MCHTPRAPHALARGAWDVRFEGRTIRVAPESITRPALLTVEGELDDITGRGQTEVTHALCASIPEARKRHHVAAGVGHMGIFSGRRWREEVYPMFCEHVRNA